MFWSVLLACAIAVRGAVHERVEIPPGWRPARRGLADHDKIQLHVALQYENLDALDAKVHSVSDPGSSAYGQYLELDELNELFAPSEDRKTRVISWLDSHSVKIFARDANTISFETTVAKANYILNASFRWYTDGTTTTLGCLSYSVPDELSNDVDIITPTTYFGSPIRLTASREYKSASPPASPESTSSIPGCHVVRRTEGVRGVFVNSTCYPTLYDIGNYIPDPKSGSNIAFASFAGVVANYADLRIFEQQFGIPQRNFSILGLINGATNNQSTSLLYRNEANLDVQTILSLVGDLPVGEYIEHGLDLNHTIDPFLKFYQYLLSKPSKDLPWVISSSYAADEAGIPTRYAARTCNAIAMLGLRGRTILAPAGDSGPGYDCKVNGKKQFTPMFPSDCPYATAVGGTENTAPVKASFDGGGGFSNLFATPGYQKNAISAYLKKYINPIAKEYYESHGYVNFSGRGIPDIAANFGGPSFPIIDAGVLSFGDGTSEATPIVASIIALLNDARFKAGKPAMGFINPWLYNVVAGKGVVDVIKGGSVGCKYHPPHIPYASWNATPGWDPVTGIGYPQFQKMVALALNATTG